MTVAFLGPAPDDPPIAATAAMAAVEDAETAAIVQVRALAKAGRLVEAGSACAAALDRHRLSAELLYLHAVLLVEGGLAREAIAAARRALYIDRGLIVGQLVLGTALARCGETTRARRAFRNAEALASALPAAACVPASDGEPAGRLLAMVRVELNLLAEHAA